MMSVSISPSGLKSRELTQVYDSSHISTSMQTAQDIGAFGVNTSNSNTNMSANQWTALEPNDFITPHKSNINVDCSCGCCGDDVGETIKADCPDVDCEDLCSQANSVHSELSLTSSKKSQKQTVHMSKCKSPLMQQHLAKIMGCRASTIAKKRAFSARIQSSPQIEESSTQCITKTFSEISIQTASELSQTMSIQTSPNLFKVDASTDFPEKVVVSTGKRRNERKVKETPEVDVSSQSSISQDVQPKNLIAKEGQAKACLKTRLDFQARAKSKIGSLGNTTHKPLGGDNKVYQRKLTFRETASSKVGSLDNIRHKPGGGDKQIIYQVVAKRPVPISSMSTFGDSNFLFLPKARESERRKSRNDDNTITRTAWSDSTEPISTVTHGNASTEQRSKLRQTKGTRSADV